MAIKELLARGVTSERRFAREAMITARLEHPGIVPVYEAGRWPDGTPFYAMKLVSGRPLRALIAERRTVDERIGLLHHVIAVADAMAYAHGRNVIHRDLKPANVIVGEFGETVVIDWGLAKDLSDPSAIGGDSSQSSSDDALTRAGSVLGTPAYMPPEQERGEAVDQRADVFAIGAMLWELCSLQKVPPRDRPQRHRLLRREGIDDDLAIIIDKSLDPDPVQRYPHAGALAADLKAFKSGARITARSYSLTALLAHWTRRHRTWVIAAAAATVLSIAGVAALIVLYRSAQSSAGTAQARLIQSYANRGRQALLDGEDIDAVLYLQQAVLGGDRTAATQFMLARAAQPFLAERAVVSTTAERTATAIYAPDGKHIAVCDGRIVRVLEARTRKLEATLEHPAVVARMVFSRDSGLLATGDFGGSVRVRMVSTGTTVWSHDDAGESPILAMALSPDHLLLATQSSTGTQLWNLATKQQITAVAHADSEYRGEIEFSADGQWLASMARDEVLILDAHSGRQHAAIPARRVSSICFDPTGPRLAVATLVGDAGIWNVVTGARERALLSSSEPLSVIRCARDGSRFATGSKLGSTWIWNARGELITGLSAARIKIAALDFDLRGGRVLAASTDGAVRIFDSTTGVLLETGRAARAALRHAALSPDGLSAIVTGWDGSAHLIDASLSYRVWSTSSIGPECNEWPAQSQSRVVVIGCGSRGTQVWDALTRALIAVLPAPVQDNLETRMAPVISEDLSRVAIAIDEEVLAYRLPAGVLERRIRMPARVTALAFLGHAVVSGDELGTLQLDDEGRRVVLATQGRAAIDAIAASAGGQVVAADEALRLTRYDVHRGASATVSFEERLMTRVRAMRVPASGDRLLTIPQTRDSAAAFGFELWDIARAARIALIGDRNIIAFSARFAHGGREILTATSDGVARLWDGRTGHLIRGFPASGVSVMDALFSPDDTQIVTAGSDGHLRFWDASSGALLWKVQAHDTHLSGMHFEGNDLVTRSSTGALAQWHLPPLAPASRLAEVLACLPVRFDAETGGTIEQPPCERDAGAVTQPR